MTALIHTETFGPADPYKYARATGTMQSRVWTAAWHIKHGKPDAALNVLRETLEQFDPAAAAILWPTPPMLSEGEMAQLIREDEAAERRADAWDRAKELAERNGEAA